MTKQRRYESDSPFSQWVRNHPELPSYDNKNNFGLVLTDVDLIFHRYLSPSETGQKREIQALMYLEVKTRNGDLNPSQKDTLFKHHRFCYDIQSGKAKVQEINGNKVIHFGYSIIKLSGTYPGDSQVMYWGRFTQDMQISYRIIDEKTLTSLLRFDIHPQSFCVKPFRLHHKERQVVERITTPLGFEIEQSIKLVS